jgi:DNA-binding transcriptional MerR regulator
MQIKDLSRRTNLSGKTIRYYEEIGILPPPRRLPNGYRDYDEGDVERVKFVVGARNLDFSLDDIDEILALRDKREAPCRVVLDMIQHRAEEISQRIVELQQLEDDLRGLHKLGQTFPMDDVDGKNCVCHLVSERAASGS